MESDVHGVIGLQPTANLNLQGADAPCVGPPPTNGDHEYVPIVSLLLRAVDLSMICLQNPWLLTENPECVFLRSKAVPARSSSTFAAVLPNTLWL